MFNDQYKPLSIRRIGIIGSGVAGLSAGLQLQARGASVTLFEKSRGPGGRLASKRVDGVDHTNSTVDMGAQFFTLRNPRFRSLLDERAYAEWPGRLRYENGQGDWEDFRQATRYVGTPRMTAISRALAAHLTINNDVRVAKLLRDDLGWHVIDADGHDHGAFDSVIMTMPPAQSQALLYASDCPQLAGVLARDVEAMQACWAVAAYFARPLELPYEGFQCRCEALQWAGNDSSKPGREGPGEWWVLHGQPDWSEAHRDDSADAVTASLLADFNRVTGLVTAPTQLLSHRWLYAKSKTRRGPGHYWFADDRLAVIGDWLTGGRVEGAFDSAASLCDHWYDEGLIGSEPSN